MDFKQIVILVASIILVVMLIIIGIALYRVQKNTKFQRVQKCNTSILKVVRCLGNRQLGSVLEVFKISETISECRRYFML